MLIRINRLFYNESITFDTAEQKTLHSLFFMVPSQDRVYKGTTFFWVCSVFVWAHIQGYGYVCEQLIWKIELNEREPIAILNIEPKILLDKNSFVLPSKVMKSNFNLPILNNFNTNPNLYPSGRKVLSENVENSIKWLQRIKIEYPSLYSDISEMKMTSDNHINIILSEYPTRIFLGKGQIWGKIEILRNFETKLSPKKLSDFKYIDIRYDNQVITKNRI